MEKQRRSAVPAAVTHLAKPHWQAKSRATPPLLLPANSRAIRRVLFQANWRAEKAGSPLPRLRGAGWRPPLLALPVTAKLFVYLAGSMSPLPVPEVLQPDWHLRPAMVILREPVRARQCLRGPGPSAFFREILDAQRRNRAARYGDCPIFVRYQRLRNRGGLVGCGNKRNHWPPKRARRGRTFPIAAWDKCQCLPRRIPD